MDLGVFDIFKIGIGPSSSHTIGPMVAAGRFIELLQGGRDIVPGAGRLARLGCRLHGSLAFTGKGHATDRAVILGLAGFRPDAFDQARAESAEQQIRASGTLSPPELGTLVFRPDTDLVFDYGPPLPGHTNALVLTAWDEADNLYARETYFSVGGGFVLTEKEMADPPVTASAQALPHRFRTAADLVALTERTGKNIARIMQDNEVARGTTDLSARLGRIWAVMDAAIERGLSAQGILPGGLKVRRRAQGIHAALKAEHGRNLTAPHIINDWIAVYAIAVNEENAAGGQVVTAPTNGAAGVVPAVIRYWLDHVPGASRDRVGEFLLTAAAIGAIIKSNASISGAEVGCQGEVGSAAAMAAGGLTAVLGGSARQVENAAEIALEHHLGMTCDPIKGLVQAPCIERNGLGAIKAVSAASLALRGDGVHLVSLDACVETMLQTGRDMSEKYKETALGGLAVNVPDC